MIVWPQTLLMRLDGKLCFSKKIFENGNMSSVSLGALRSLYNLLRILPGHRAVRFPENQSHDSIPTMMPRFLFFLDGGGHGQWMSCPWRGPSYVFYIKQFIDPKVNELGILRALGYSNDSWLN